MFETHYCLFSCSVSSVSRFGLIGTLDVDWMWLVKVVSEIMTVISENRNLFPGKSTQHVF